MLGKKKNLKSQTSWRSVYIIQYSRLQKYFLEEIHPNVTNK